MNKKIINDNQVYGFLPLEIEGMDLLAELALDMRWSWNHQRTKYGSKWIRHYGS